MTSKTKPIYLEDSLCTGVLTTTLMLESSPGTITNGFELTIPQSLKDSAGSK